MYRYPVYRPSLTGNERGYVDEAIDSTWISSRGPFVSKFEESFASYTGAEYATTVCNGTVAIHLALTALGVGPGDEVIVPTFTYIASVNPVVQVGAVPVFVDSLPDTWQMSPKDVEKKITSRTRALIVVHLYGHPADMDALMKLAQEYDLYVIEDCAEAIGSRYKGRHVGVFGDIATFSFFGNKTITCGEGGMVLTNDATLNDRIVRFKGQGLAKDREYWHDIIGFNYRMTNVAAAIGLAQLEQIEDFLEKKGNIAEQYRRALSGSPHITFHEAEERVRHSYWMCSILVEKSAKRDELRNHLKNHGIETRPAFFPVHTMPPYAVKYERHEIAENLASRGINLPSYPQLDQKDVEFICQCIREWDE